MFLLIYILDLTYWYISRGNYKGNSVEQYHRYLNNTQAIADNDRGTCNVYLQNTNTSQYAWNSAPIDNTDITRSMVDIGWSFRFPFDIKISPIPLLNKDTSSILSQYIRVNGLYILPITSPGFY